MDAKKTTPVRSKAYKDKIARKTCIPVRFCLLCACFGIPEVELVWLSVWSSLLSPQYRLVFWYLDHYSWLLTTYLDLASLPCLI